MISKKLFYKREKDISTYCYLSQMIIFDDNVVQVMTQAVYDAEPKQQI